MASSATVSILEERLPANASNDLSIVIVINEFSVALLGPLRLTNKFSQNCLPFLAPRLFYGI